MRTTSILASLFATVVLASCSTIAPVHTPERLEASAFPVPLPSAAVEPGTLLEFRFFYQPELNDTQEVRADGKVALPLVGDVHVAGLTPAEIRQRLRTTLASQITDPEVTVIVRRPIGNHVLVGGEVHKPGAVPFVPRLTVLEAVLTAGGPNLDLANLGNVVVVRDADGQRHGYAVDMRQAFHGEAGASFFLQPRDVVFVPRTAIADVDRWIEQNINKVVPQFGITYTVPAGNGTFGVDTAIRR